MRKFVIIVLLLSAMQVNEVQVEAKKVKQAKTSDPACQSRKEMGNITSFTYQQSGGFAGINRSYCVKLADLSKEDREKLEKLIAESGLLSMKNESKTTPGAADMFFYEFSVVNGGEHKATFDDGSLPEAFRPLLEHVREKATNEPRS